MSVRAYTTSLAAGLKISPSTKPPAMIFTFRQT